MTAGGLHLRDEGEGRPLVLVHGYLGSGRHWDAQFDAFAPRRRVIAPDLAGFGASNGLDAPDGIAGHATLIWDALDRIGVSGIDLLGHSMGGMVAQEMTAQAPARVRRLVLYGTGPVGVLPGRFETIADSRARIERDGVEATARRIAANWFADGVHAPGYALCVREGLAATEQAALASLAAWEGWDGRAALAAIRAPTLAIWGDRDRSYPRGQPQALVEGIPDCRLEIFPGHGHALHLEDPDRFNRALAGFLDAEDETGEGPAT